MFLSTNPEETNVKTPGHFLIGQPVESIPQPDFTAISKKWSIKMTTATPHPTTFLESLVDRITSYSPTTE